MVTDMAIWRKSGKMKKAWIEEAKNNLHYKKHGGMAWRRHGIAHGRHKAAWQKHALRLKKEKSIMTYYDLEEEAEEKRM